MKAVAIPAVSLAALLFSHLAYAGTPPAPSASPARAALEVEILSPLGKPIPRGRAVLFSIQTGEDLPPCAGYQELPAVDFSEGKLSQSLPSGRYRLEIVADGWQGAVEEELDLSPGDTKKVRLRLEPGYVIAGQVTDEGGLPLGGASVSASFRGKRRVWIRSEEGGATADADGRFRLSTLAEGLYRVKVSMPGRVEVSLDDIGTGTEDLAVVMKKGLAIKGRLAGFTRGLGPLVEVDLKKNWEILYKKAPVDAEGVFIVGDLEPGSYDLRVKDQERVSGWVRQVRAEEASVARPVTVEVVKGAKIAGQVFDARNGERIRGAHLKLAQDDSSLTNFATQDEETGEYSFSLLLPGTYQVQVLKDLFSSSGPPLAAREVVLAAGQELKGVDFRIDPGEPASLIGMVVDESGAPVPEASVRLYRRRAGESSSRMLATGESARSDSSGEFLIKSYISGETECVLYAERDGFAPARCDPLLLSSASPSASGVVLVLGAGLALEVEVADAEGNPVPLARVELSKDYKRTADRDGDFASFFREKKLSNGRGLCRFDHLAPRAYALTVVKKGFAERKEPVDFSPGETEKKVQAVLERGRTVTVSVRDSAGDPVSGAKVHAAPATAGGFTFALHSRDLPATDAAGVCRVENLPFGPLLVSVSGEGFVSSLGNPVAPDRDAVEVVLRAGGAIAGRAVSAGGKPPERVSVRAQRRKRDPFDLDLQVGDKEDQGGGRFRISGLKPGLYDLYVDAKGWARRRAAEVEVIAGETVDAGEIVLEPEAVVSGRIVDRAGKPLGRGMVSIRGASLVGGFAGADDATGRFAIRNLPAGTFTLVVNCPGYRHQEIPGIELAAGAEKDLPPTVLDEMTPEEREKEEGQALLVPSLGLSWGKEMSIFESGGFSVGEVKGGSAAESAGIRPGDAIIKVNGKGIQEDPGGFLRGIYGKPGSKVKLAVRHRDGGETDEVEIVIPEWDYDQMIRKMEF